MVGHLAMHAAALIYTIWAVYYFFPQHNRRS
jgi:hypothetical protein